MTGTIEKIEKSTGKIVEKSSGILDETKSVIENISNLKEDAVKEITETISLGDKYLGMLLDYLAGIGPKIIGAVLVLWIGFKIINFLNKLVTKSLEKVKIDPMLKAFSISFVSILLKIMVFLSAAGMLGVETTSFLALFTAAGVAIGMSLSGTLQNFAGGMIILAFKLYRIDDFVSIGGNEGTVKDIHIFHTVIVTLDRKTVIVPNSQISNGIMINFSTEPIRRQDMSFGVDYKTDINLIRKLILELTDKDERIIKNEKEEQKTTIFVNELRDSGILLTVRFFVKTENLISVKNEIFEKILELCRENNIKMAHPMREVFIYNKDE